MPLLLQLARRFIQSEFKCGPTRSITLPVAPLGSRGLQEQCNLCRRLGPDTFHESQPPRPMREPQLVPAVLDTAC
eukprot:8733120-Pyramimonas_sp.AAC.1